MRWLTFFIFAYVVVGLQLGIGHYLDIKGAGPNLVLIGAVFIAGHAPREPGLLGAFLLGLFQDLLTLQPPGLFALSYGLTAMMVMSSRQAAYGDHPLTHFVLTLGGGLLTAAILYIHGKIRPVSAAPAEDGTLSSSGVALWPLILAALYTAILSPAVLWLMGKLKRPFGFRTARSRY